MSTRQFKWSSWRFEGRHSVRTLIDANSWRAACHGGADRSLAQLRAFPSNPNDSCGRGVGPPRVTARSTHPHGAPRMGSRIAAESAFFRDHERRSRLGPLRGRPVGSASPSHVPSSGPPAAGQALALAVFGWQGFTPKLT
jgi:hypothetical protein